MLKTIFGKPPDPKVAREHLSKSATNWRGNLDRLKALLDYFPIGKKLRYYPEFKKDIVFDTFVVAYCVNGNFLYSADAIERDSDGNPTLFRTGEHGEQTSVSDVKLFQLRVPDTSDLEMKLDYHRRALIGRGRQFIKGNFISLISNAAGRGDSRYRGGEADRPAGWPLCAHETDPADGGTEFPHRHRSTPENARENLCSGHGDGAGGS